MKKILSVIALLVASSSAHADEPQRDQGINLHQMPASAAHPDDAVKRQPGFIVTYSDRLQPTTSQPILRTAAEVASFTQSQSDNVRSNGVWIVVPDSRDSSDSERHMVSAIKEGFRKGGIPLFICEAGKLPDGWVRWDEPKP